MPVHEMYIIEDDASLEPKSLVRLGRRPQNREFFQNSVQPNINRSVIKATDEMFSSASVSESSLYKEDEFAVNRIEERLVALISSVERKQLLQALESIGIEAEQLVQFIDSLERSKHPIESFVQRACRLDELDRTDTALDLIYDSVDELLCEGKFELLNSILSHTSVNTLSVDLHLAILTATLPAISRLPSRPRFFDEVEQVLRYRGEFEEGLLSGLEG